MGLQILKNERGGAVTSALVVAAVVGLVGYIMFAGFAHTIKIDTLQDMKSYQNNLYGEILYDVSTANCGVTTLRNGAQASYVKVEDPLSVGIIADKDRPSDGIESSLFSIYYDTAFKEFRVKSIFFMAYDSHDGHLQDYLVNCTKKSYCRINSTNPRYLAQIGVVFESPKHELVNTILKYPVIIDVNDEGAVTKCLSARQNIKEFCVNSDGTWDEQNFKCSVKNLEANDSGKNGFCTMGEACNIQENFRWPI
jgi:hypothetical protein